MSDETFFWHRLRWRFRGAWMWPAFVLVTVADAFVLSQLPPVRTGMPLLTGLLIALFSNLFFVCASVVLGTMLLARRRLIEGPGEAIRDVYTSRIGTGFMVVGLLITVVLGLAARPNVVVETEAREQNAEAVRDFVLASSDDEVIRNLDTANSIRLGEDYFRTCVALDDRERFFCVFVDTDRTPPNVVKDPSAEPNSVYNVP